MKPWFFLILIFALICPVFAFCEPDGRLERCEPYRACVSRLLRENGISEDYFYLMAAESGCRDSAKSSKGALGFWQMMPATGRAHGCADLHDLECATRAAASYLKDLSTRFRGDDIIAAYNMGGHNLARNGRTAEAKGLIAAFKKLKRQGKEKDMLVLIEGNIAAGKSTICEALQGHHFPEPLIGFLPLYYDDPCRWGYAMQMTVLTHRYRQWKLAQAICLNDAKADCLLDRSLFFDHCFARMVHKQKNMTDLEYQSYVDLHSVLQEQIYFPDICLWLRCKPETCLERLKTRSRSCEAGVPLEYLAALDAEYEDAMQTFSSKCPVVEIDAEKDSWNVLSQCQRAIAQRRETINDTWPRWKGGL